ncbi:DUF1643 domain-containing protein [Micromonospora sp. NPDC007208]|uniref:DUF1643 domain-containing protein n=1 Tax=Micromonospora sp. NPDC007208 TaxID=3364236 RepID=UPI00369D3E15
MTSGEVGKDLLRPVPICPLTPTERRLLAVLCNPPLGAAKDTTSWRNLEVLAGVLHADSVDIANLIEEPTRSTRDLFHVAGKVDLETLTFRLKVAAQSADVVVAGWGVGAPAGWRKHEWLALIEAAVRGLAAGGHDRVAHVGRSPRHPSRWRQHTSPIHDRYAGATFELRLAAALRWSPIESTAATDKRVPTGPGEPEASRARPDQHPPAHALDMLL